MLSSYPSIYAVGHRYIADLFTGPVTIEEKIDGSQFSFGISTFGVLEIRSKGNEIFVDSPEKMFSKAVQTVLSIKDQLTPGWTYRGEYLQKPKHNALTYSRTPAGNIILFDIMIGPEEYMKHSEKQVEAHSLGLECVPCFHEGEYTAASQSLQEFFARESVLGGAKIEGVVVKNYARFGIDKKILIGKFVSEAFKEIHRTSWKIANPGPGDVVQHIISELKTDARWRKAVQHLRDAGKLTDTPQDIGPLMKELAEDLEREATDHVKEALFKHFWSQIKRGATGGFPEWYKAELGIVTETPAK